MTVETDGRNAAADLARFAGETVEIGGKTVEGFVDEGTVTVETVAGGKSVVQEVEVTVSNTDFPDRVPENTKGVVRGSVLFVEESEPGPGFQTLTLQRGRAR